MRPSLSLEMSCSFQVAGLITQRAWMNPSQSPAASELPSIMRVYDQASYGEGGCTDSRTPAQYPGQVL